MDQNVYIVFCMFDQNVLITLYELSQRTKTIKLKKDPKNAH